MIVAPSKGVTGLKVVPITTSSVEVHWNMINEVHWSGDHETGGYRIVYQPVSDFPTPLETTPKEDILGIKVCFTFVRNIVYHVQSDCHLNFKLKIIPIIN